MAALFEGPGKGNVRTFTITAVAVLEDEQNHDFLFSTPQLEPPRRSAFRSESAKFRPSRSSASAAHQHFALWQQRFGFQGQMVAHGEHNV